MKRIFSSMTAATCKSLICFASLFLLNSSCKAFKAIPANAITAADTLNVKTFGAIGDNKKDDGPALQKALDEAAKKDNTIVLVPEGIYLITDPGNGDSGHGKNGLRIGSHTTLLLQSNTVLHKTGNDEIIANKDRENGNTDIVIEGGVFETASGTDQKWAPTRTGIHLVNVSHSVIKNCKFRHIGNSAVIIGGKSENNVVSNCDFTDIFNCGVELFGLNNKASNNYLHDMGSDGILVKGSQCIVADNKLINIGFYSAPSLGSAISIGADNVNCNDNKIISNYIDSVAAYGIIDDRGANTLIDKNTVTNTGSSGIKIGGEGQNSLVTNNIISNTGQSKTGSGVYFHTGLLIDGAGVKVLNNKLSNITGTGIYVNENANNVTVSNCKVIKTIASPDDKVESTAVKVKSKNTTVQGLDFQQTTYKKQDRQ